MNSVIFLQFNWMLGCKGGTVGRKEPYPKSKFKSLKEISPFKRLPLAHP